MATSHEPEHDPLTELGYETRDMHYRPVASAVFWFFVFTFVMGVVGFIFMMLWLPGFPSPENTTAPFMRHTPPSKYPLLQNNITNVTDIETLRRQEDAVLNHYSWANPDHTRAHIPIEAAIAIIAKQGLPETPPASAPPSNTSPGGARQP